MKREDAAAGVGPRAAAGAPADEDTAWRELLEAAAAPYRASGKFAWHFARGKLARDPVFRGMLQRGDLAGRQRVVDIGCGQGLLASLLHACASTAPRHGEATAAGAGGWPASSTTAWPVSWPASWPAGVAYSAYTGIELMPRDVQRAQAALAALRPKPEFVCGDMRTTPLPACDLVVILDVLHYVDHAAQAELLTRVRTALQPAGRLLLRVGDVASAGGFAASQWVDRIVTWTRGHRVPPTYGRTVAAWSALLGELDFDVEAVPMHRGTPFANVLLVADLQPSTA